MNGDTLPPALCQTLSAARRIGVITGAGISAESGIPTYRGQGGLYDDPEAGARNAEALSGPTLRSDPARTWRVVRALARRCAQAEPNAAHRALVHMESRAERFTLLTQNVDGLHERAGQRNMIEIHGNTFDVRCMTCAWCSRWAPSELIDSAAVPRCPQCGGIVRPDVVFFGEMLPTRKLARIELEFFVQPLDVLLVVGTSALFAYIVEPVLHARRQGVCTIDVNPEASELSGIVDWHLARGAGAVVPHLAEAFGAA